MEQKFDILLNKFEQQVNINNYILQNLGENQNYISKIDQKLDFLNTKTDQNYSQNIFVKNENLQIYPTINQNYTQKSQNIENLNESNNMSIDLDSSPITPKSNKFLN